MVRLPSASELPFGMMKVAPIRTLAVGSFDVSWAFHGRRDRCPTPTGRSVSTLCTGRSSSTRTSPSPGERISFRRCVLSPASAPWAIRWERSSKRTRSSRLGTDRDA
jgi:hypothetical protein